MKTTDFSALRIHYMNLAVANATGILKMNIKLANKNASFPRICGDSSLLKRVGDEFSYEEVLVPSISFPDLIAKWSFQDKTMACWIDLEGAINQVLMNSENAFASCLSVMCEVEESAKWKGQWLWPQVRNYFFKMGFLPIARDFEWDGQYNVVFVKKEVADSHAVRLCLARHFSRLGCEGRASIAMAQA